MPNESTDRNVIVFPTVLLRKLSSVNQSSMGCRTSTLPHVCGDFELSLAVVFMVLAGILIFALLYWALLLRHKLRAAQAGNALEYFGFYHMARYDLKEPNLSVVTPSFSSPPVPQPPLHVTPPPPPPPMLYMSPPIIHTTPPSPHPSCGASSDAEVYSRIGVLRPSRPSSVSQTQVILFEHSAL
ncbi:Leucine-rich repeat-containing protein 70 [Labeo rohita]|uniref:Leucine-rich repeat-containing protein 70 n=2 Tax=Labeo rohita TaxID=84645 RepID=A0ABQ8LM00_LABRO|nr:uncharacterized protein LOC127152352 isoform X1 [Labeo rohita]KAI2651404.1 Leucine-rich repeat-containing protein 70 [Labeo rohita]